MTITHTNCHHPCFFIIRCHCYIVTLGKAENQSTILVIYVKNSQLGQDKTQPKGCQIIPAKPNMNPNPNTNANKGTIKTLVIKPAKEK